MTERRSHLPCLAIFVACLVLPADPARAVALPTEIGEAIVGFAPGSLPDVSAGETLEGFAVRSVVARGSFIVVAAPDLAPLREALRTFPGVAYVEDNALLHALATATPDDTRYGEQYGPPMMGFPAAWDVAGYGSPEVTVAVLDTGLQKTHPDFEAGRILQGYDYVNGDTNPNDDCGHGTHVSGTVAATTDNARGVAGMSQATLLPMKVLSPFGFLINVTCSGSTAVIAEAILDAADQGARVISMSLGGSSGSNTMRNAVDAAWGRGVLVIAAAGNDSGGPVSYPAAYSSVIAVSAVASNKSLASYSSTGPEVEVAAPGSNVLSTYNDSGYRSLSGTSMATPHVSGALALAASCRSSATGEMLRTLLQQTAEDLGAAGKDTSYGYGLARIDRLLARLGSCDGSGGPGNAAPTASFTLSSAGLQVTVDGSGSSDPDGDSLSFLWDFGDGTTATGETATHTYAASGTYLITLTVNDGNGGSDDDAKSLTVSGGGPPADPDPSTPNLQSGKAQSVTLSGRGDDEHYKIFVPAGSSQLRVAMTGPGCGLLGCSFDADLYVRRGARATDTSYDCRPYLSSNNETCTLTSPTSGWWYVRVKSYQGSGSVTVTPTVSP